MKDKGWGVEDVIGFITFAIIVISVIAMAYNMSDHGEDASAPRTSTHCEEHEGYMGNVVVVCERD